MHPTSPQPLLSADRILNNLVTAVLLLDHQLRIVAANSAAEHLISISENKLRGECLHLCVRFPAAFENRMRDALTTSECYIEREVAMTLSHQHRELLVDCSISHGLSGGQKWILLELIDIGQHARIEREQALVAQQQASELLLRELAHEVKNPLGGLRGAAQLLDSELDDSALTEYTSIIISEADRLHALIDRLLGPSAQPRFTEVNIHETLEHVKQLVSAETSDNLLFSNDYDPSIPQLWADRDWLVQAFLNIVRNAVQAVGDRGNIVFKTRVQRMFNIRSVVHKLIAVVQFVDDGPGIPTNISRTLFNPMVSGRQGGHGLGLSIAQRLIGQLGGLIESSSEPDHTVFTVYLPLGEVLSPGDADE
jgi:two-component system nitrogen regulation sensor histidine kinase GlnL